MEVDKYPLLRIYLLLEKGAGTDWYTKIDLKSGYYQVPRAKESIPVTMFNSLIPI